MNNNLDFIFNRESVRDYKAEKIKKEDLDLILKAAMSGPSCLNKRDYAFIVIDSKDELKELASIIGPSANPLNNASLAIAVLMDDSRAFELGKDYKVIDSTIAAQNIMLAANCLNIGSVMLGIYPLEDKIKKMSEYFNLPSYMKTNSIISLGYKKVETKGKNHFEEDRIHHNKW